MVQDWSPQERMVSERVSLCSYQHDQDDTRAVLLDPVLAWAKDLCGLHLSPSMVTLSTTGRNFHSWSGRRAAIRSSAYHHLPLAKNVPFTLRQRSKAPCPHVHVTLGGPNVIMDPEHVLLSSAADSVRIHEGEIPVSNLIRDPASLKKGQVPGLWFKSGTATVKNPFSDVIHDLDQIPLENYKKSRFGSFKRLSQDGFVQESTLTEHIDNPCMPDAFIYMLTTRGCPFSCSYCINSTAHAIEGQAHCPQIRRMSIRHTIAQIQKAVADNKSIRGVFFFDDDFSLRTEEELAEFCQRYATTIQLPFYVFANPNTTTNRKLDSYASGGLRSIEFGLQTVSERVLNEYKRPQNAEHLRRILNYVAAQAYAFDVSVDVITNSPFETPDDVAETISYVLGLPGDFQLYVHSLHLFPGSPLHRKHKHETGNEYHEYQDNYSASQHWFNKYHTKILFAMQGWHRASAPDQFGELTRREIESLLVCPEGEQAEQLGILDRRMDQTPVAQFYKRLHNMSREHEDQNYVLTRRK